MNKKDKEKCFPQHGSMYKTSKYFMTNPWNDCWDDLWIAVKPLRNYINRFWLKHLGDYYNDWVGVLRVNIIKKFGHNLIWYMRDGIELKFDNGIKIFYEYFAVDETGRVCLGGCSKYDYTTGTKHPPLYFQNEDGDKCVVTAPRKSSFYKQIRAQEKDAKRKSIREYKKRKEEISNTILHDIEKKRLQRLKDENFQKIIKHGFDPVTSFRRW